MGVASASAGSAGAKTKRGAGNFPLLPALRSSIAPMPALSCSPPCPLLRCREEETVAWLPTFTQARWGEREGAGANWAAREKLIVRIRRRFRRRLNGQVKPSRRRSIGERFCASDILDDRQRKPPATRQSTEDERSESQKRQEPLEVIEE